MIDMVYRNANTEIRPGLPEAAWICNLGKTDTVTVKLA